MSVPPPPYAVLGNHGSLHQQPPPYRRPIPRYDSRYDRGSCGISCCRFICGFCCCLFLLIIVVACFLVYLYLALQPKMPSYNVKSLEVKTLDIQPNTGILNLVLLVSIKAENPNQQIGIIYGKDSSVIVSYKDTNLCYGELPSFYQGPENTTIMNIELKGKTKLSPDLQGEFLESKSQGRIPLLVIVKVPVEVVAGEFLSRSFIVHVYYALVVDNLSPNKKARIISSDYTVHTSM